jgi:UDP-glucose 4-epimerase
MAAEALVAAYSASYGLPALTFRFFNVYGPLQTAEHSYAAVIPSFLDAALHGRALRVYGDGLQSRDFVFVGSVAEILAEAAIRHVRSRNPVNLALGKGASLLELIDTLRPLLSVAPEIEFSAPRPGDVTRSHACVESLRELFPGYQGVPLEVGLKQTLSWFQGLQQYSKDEVFA